MQHGISTLVLRASRWLLLLAVGLLLAVSASLQQAHAAGGERYDYDGLGRLIRAISSTGVVTEYVYDGAGNITAVIRGAAAAPPTLTSAAPASLRRGSQVRVTLIGTQLQNASLQALDRGLTISGVTRTATALEFDLAASSQATLGASTLRVSSAAGTANITIVVRPNLPVVELSPLPIAVPPDGRSGAIDILLSSADDQEHVVNFTTANPAVATVAPSSVVIPAGATKATVFVTGRSAGNTELRLASASLGDRAYPIFVLAAFEGINSARAALVGVELAAAAGPGAGITALWAARPVGLVRATTAWIETSPRFVSQGGSQTLRFSGVGLPPDLAVAIAPSTGLVMGAVAVAPDGTSATVQVSAQATAAQGARRITLQTGATALRPIGVDADVLDVVAPLPQVTSVQPMFLLPGTTLAAFEIRGRNLQDVTGVSVLGGGVTTGTSFTVNAEGSLLTLGLQVSVAADPGPRVVVVSAPAGSSSAVASPSNTVTVVQDGAELQPYPALGAPPVGVVLGDDTLPPSGSGTVPVAANAVGLAVGAFAQSVEPRAIARTETISIRVRGQGLASVDSATLSPATGLSIGTVTPSPDGTEVVIVVTATADAPLTARRLEIASAGTRVAVVGNGALALQVTPLSPVIDSIEPNAVRASGTAFTLIVRGRNFQGASGLRVSPAAGVTVGTLTVNAEGTQAQAQVSVATDAARGARVVTIQGLGSDSSAVPSPSNVLNIVDGVALSDMPSVLVGVVLGDENAGVDPGPRPPINALVAAPRVGLAVGAVQPEGLRDTVYARIAGVVVEAAALPGQLEKSAVAQPAGLTLGPVVLGVEPAAAVPGQLLTVVLRGQALPADSTLEVLPAGSAAFSGAATVDADGAALRQSLTVNLGAPLGLRLRVLRGNGTPIPSAAVDGPTLTVLPGLPEVVSLEPILARQGDTVTLIVRGVRLGQVTRVAAEPAAGIDFASGFTVNAAGTELSIRLSVQEAAALGARVIRLFNALGGSASQGAPANTFTVFPKP